METKGKRFDDQSSWVPRQDDMDHCARCGLTWDQHAAGTVAWCPRVLESPPSASEEP